MLSARGLNPSIRIIAQAIEKNTMPKIKKAGADDVVLTDAIGGMRIASTMLRPTVVSFLDGMLKGGDQHLRVEEAPIRAHSTLIDTTIAQSRISERTGLIIVALKDKNTNAYIYNPPSIHVLREGDILIVIGDQKQVEKLFAITQPS